MTDYFPSLNEAFTRKVQTALEENFLKEEVPEIAWEDWVKLKRYLAAYKKEAEYVRGFLNKGDAKLLHDISKRSAALLTSLERANSKGLGKIITETIGHIDEQDFKATLCKLHTDYDLGKQIAPELEDMSRANLFSSFEAWWMRATDLPPAIEEGSAEYPHPTPFMFVASEVFNLPGMPAPPGSSYKSLKDFRRADRNRFKYVRDLADALHRRRSTK